MKIVIAGGSGFLGTSLLDLWKDQNHEIIILTRKKTSKLTAKYSNLQIITWDPLQTGDWVNSLEQSDVVINLVGQSLASGFRWTGGVKKKLVESRTIPSQTLAQAVQQLQHKPKLFIQISGINYYDFSFDEQDENSSVGKNFLAQLCIDWENASQSVEQVGVSRTIIRLAPVISKQSLLIKLLRLPYRLFAGGRYGLRGDQWFSWVDVNDFVHFIDFTVQKNLSGVYNLSSPNPIQNKDMNRIIGKTLKRPWFFPVPGFMLKIVLGQKSDLLLKSVRVVSHEISKTGYTFLEPEFATSFKHQMTKKKV